MEKNLEEINKLFSKKEKRKTKSIIFFKKNIIWLLLVFVLLFISFFTPIFKSREITISAQETKQSIVDLGILGMIYPSQIKNKERVNLLFLGIPGKGNNAPSLTDTIIILNSTPGGENPVGISIPRDLFVKNPNQDYYTKINALYQNEGIDAVKTTIKQITGLEIDYFIVVDLNGVKNLIDYFDGIDVFVESDIYDPQFPALYNSFEIFYLEKGQHHLDGETALKYIRSRNQAGGDFARIKRQQQIIVALKDKILNLNPFWDFPKFLKIWDNLKEHTNTNIGLTDIKYAWNLAKNSDFEEIEFTTISNQPNEEEQLLISAEINLSGQKAYILKPKAGLDDYQEIKNYINKLIQNQ